MQLVKQEGGSHREKKGGWVLTWAQGTDNQPSVSKYGSAARLLAVGPKTGPRYSTKWRDDRNVEDFEIWVLTASKAFGAGRQNGK